MVYNNLTDNGFVQHQKSTTIHYFSTLIAMRISRALENRLKSLVCNKALDQWHLRSLSCIPIDVSAVGPNDPPCYPMFHSTTDLVQSTVDLERSSDTHVRIITLSTCAASLVFASFLVFAVGVL